jgi:hypothetical protein
MGLFDDLFGSKQSVAEKGTSTTASNSTQNSSGTTSSVNNTTQNQTSSGNTTSNTTQNQATTGVNTVSTLDDASKAALTALLGPLLSNAQAGAGGSSNADALNAIAQQFQIKSGTEAGLVQSATDAAVNKAKLDFQTGEGAQVKSVAQQIGSTGNTFSQQLDAKAQNDLATQIAAIASSGALQASGLASDDLKAAISALATSSSVGSQEAGSTLAPLLQVISLLKGADTTSTTQQNTVGNSATGASSSENTVANQIAEIVGNTTENTSQSGTQLVNTTANQNKSSKDGIIPSILSIFS